MNKKTKKIFKKHGISFQESQKAFNDSSRVITKDKKHSTPTETRYFCYGKIDQQICVVRFTFRNKKIRIIGAGYWRKERKIYEKVNQEK